MLEATLHHIIVIAEPGKAAVKADADLATISDGGMVAP
jgi:hypothetical protein